MAKKSNLYTQAELEFLEEQVKESIQFLKNRPFSTLQDRMSRKQTRNGGYVETCIASIEDQAKANILMMEKLLNMLPALETMRERLAEGPSVKGNYELPESLRGYMS